MKEWLERLRLQFFAFEEWPEPGVILQNMADV